MINLKEIILYKVIQKLLELKSLVDNLKYYVTILYVPWK